MLPGPRTYVVGDIHGSLGKLRGLMVRCERDAGDQPKIFIFIGDYIDRGRDSRGVVEYLIDLQARMPRVICLMGNHEALALAAVDGDADVDIWLLNGGDMTLRSYHAAGASGLPSAHVAWFRSLPLTHDDGRRLFVHAGVNPAKPLDAQDEDDLLWIREPFLSDPRDYGRLVVHGHTPLTTGIPDVRPNRVNIDTAAVFGGPLTAAVFAGDQTAPIDFIQTSW
jgi:diadenosine tetraphosphatase ApaH/serine/threonine PP2A family protein phosphatase